MVQMNRESYIGMGVAIAIFLLVLPLVINNGLSHQFVSNSSLDKFNNYTGVTLSYYAAIFGGFVGGVFTYAGVKLSLDNQDEFVESEAMSHKNMLLTQLKYSYNMISALEDFPEDKIPDVRVLVFDKNWHSHLLYVKSLDRDDLENIYDWFRNLLTVEMGSITSVAPTAPVDTMVHVAQMFTLVPINATTVLEYCKNRDSIKSIIDKLESDDNS